MQCAQCVSKQLVAERMRIKHWEAIRCSKQLVAESTVAYYAKQVDKNKEERKAEGHEERLGRLRLHHDDFAQDLALPGVCRLLLAVLDHRDT